MSSTSTPARLAVASAFGLGLALALAGPASADPKGDVFPVDCDNGVTYLVTANGNGDFTPAHDSASTSVLIPVSFGEFSGTITDQNGEVVDSFVDPPRAKGPAKNADVHCTFTITNTFDDPDLGPLTFTGTGSVSGFVTPRGK